VTEYELVEAIRYVLATYVTDPWPSRLTQWVYSSMPPAGFPELPCIVVDDNTLPRTRTQINVSQTARKLKRDYVFRIYFYTSASFEYLPSSTLLAREDLCRYYGEAIADALEGHYPELVAKVRSLNADAKLPQGIRPRQISQIFYDDNSSIYYCFYEFQVKI
jgi:hypothetical protein